MNSTGPGVDAAADRSARGRSLVSTANPLASQAAAQVLAGGGSAADAAVAAQAVLGLVEPHASGLGGGTVIVWHDAWLGRSGVIDGLACAPAGVTDRLEIDARGHRIPRERVLFGGWTVGVPGTVKAMAVLHQRFGRQPWASLFDAARGLAGGGFALPPYLVKTLREIGSMQDERLARAVYGQGQAQVRPPGTVVRNPEFEHTLGLLAEQGPDVFYEDSPLSAEVLRAVREDAMPGPLTLADLRAYRVVEREALAFTLGEHRLLTAPPPVFGGLAVYQILGMLDALGHSREDPAASIDQLHRVAEAGRLAFADRGAYLGDPAYGEVPIAEMADHAYLASQAGRIDMGHILREATPGEPRSGLSAASDGTGITSAMTSHLVVADSQGLCVSMTTTINQNFGARVSAAGFFLNNALTNFARVPVAGGRRPSANAMEPGKRPITSFSPTIVCDAAGRPCMLIGAGGGNRIVGYVANAILRYRSGQRDAQAIIDAPHALNWNGMTDLEPALAGHAEALRARGHWTMVRRMDGGTQGCVRHDGLWSGAADPRRDGVAIGI